MEKTPPRSFEEQLHRVEEIVQELEQGDLPLERSLKRYEEGIKLLQFCHKRLEQVRKRIEVLTKSADGTFKLRPFEEGAEGGEEHDRT